MKVLGIITARGGSKGIPGKNIKKLVGKPLVTYTIEAAKKSKIFDRIILSTDDKKIANVATRHGIEVPFMRPAKLAGDRTPHLPVLQHAVKWLENNEGYKPDYVAILQPTAPLRQSWHLREALKLLLKTKADSILSVMEIPGHYSPYWTIVKNKKGLGSLFVGGPIKNRIPRRQIFPKKTYTNSGAVYMFKTKLLFNPKGPNFYGNKVAIYEVDNKYNVDIDEPEDWALAKQAIKKLKNNKI